MSHYLRQEKKVCSISTLIYCFCFLPFRSKAHQVSHYVGFKIFQDEKTKEAVHWLSPLNFYAKYADTFGRRAEGTGNWLLETPEFKEWLDGDRNYLVCTGMREYYQCELIFTQYANILVPGKQ